jgi:WD40 repeat protein
MHAWCGTPTILTRITAQVSFNGPVEVRVLAAQFSIDGKFVITGDVKGNIRLWHIEGVKQVTFGHGFEGPRISNLGRYPRGETKIWAFSFF